MQQDSRPQAILKKIYQNGSMEISPGMVSDLMSGSADLIVASLTMMYERDLVIDFLQPIYPEDAGIFIKKELLQNEFDFEVFVQPFGKFIWFTILFTTCVTSLLVVLIRKCVGQEDVSIFSSLSVFSSTLLTNLGSANFEAFGNRFTSMKIVSFTALLMGNVIWLSYNGSLLSELITHKVIKPFYDWESFVSSPYTLNTDPRDFSFGSLFAQSKPNTIYRAILDKSMDELSFNQPHESMKRTVTNVNHAKFGDLYSVQTNKEMRCKVLGCFQIYYLIGSWIFMIFSLLCRFESAPVYG